MRIVSGKYKRREIKYPKTDKTRPTTDKVRESIFNIIGPYFQGGQVLDLFAGSGSMGLESLSRGADFCYFVDKDIEAFKIIKDNIQILKITDAEIIKTDYLSALTRLKSKKFDLVFLDPPYHMESSYNEIIDFMIENDMLEEAALIVCEHKKEITLESKLEKIKEVTYGITSITVFEK